MSLSENNSENKIPPENSGSFEYNFSGREIKLLARFLRKTQSLCRLTRLKNFLAPKTDFTLE